MLKELKINKTYTISLETLYNYYINKKIYFKKDSTITFFGFELEHTQSGYSEDEVISFTDYYDLIDLKTGKIVCMDGETVRVLNHELDCYTLISEEGGILFQLSQDEVNQCIFGL